MDVIEREEEKKQLGGMLRYGIPAYRFPREKLDAEIASILSTGVEVRKKEKAPRPKSRGF